MSWSPVADYPILMIPSTALPFMQPGYCDQNAGCKERNSLHAKTWVGFEAVVDLPLGGRQPYCYRDLL